MDSEKETRDVLLIASGSEVEQATEADTTQPWYCFVGLDGAVIGLDRCGDSAPAALLFKKYEITAVHVVEMVN